MHFVFFGGVGRGAFDFEIVLRKFWFPKLKLGAQFQVLLSLLLTLLTVSDRAMFLLFRWGRRLGVRLLLPYVRLFSHLLLILAEAPGLDILQFWSVDALSSHWCRPEEVTDLLGARCGAISHYSLVGSVGMNRLLGGLCRVETDTYSAHLRLYQVLLILQAPHIYWRDYVLMLIAIL